jgi:hypothetical protein
MTGGDARRAHAARPSSDDKQIGIEFGHVAPGGSALGQQRI